MMFLKLIKTIFQISRLQIKKIKFLVKIIDKKIKKSRLLYKELGIEYILFQRNII